MFVLRWNYLFTQLSFCSCRASKDTAQQALCCMIYFHGEAQAILKLWGGQKLVQITCKELLWLSVAAVQRHLDWIKLCPNIYNRYYWNWILLNMLHTKCFSFEFFICFAFFFSTRNYWYKWINVGKYWRFTLLQSVGSQRVGHNWATEQQQILRTEPGTESFM